MSSLLSESDPRSMADLSALLSSFLTLANRSPPESESSASLEEDRALDLRFLLGFAGIGWLEEGRRDIFFGFLSVNGSGGSIANFASPLK